MLWCLLSDWYEDSELWLHSQNKWSKYSCLNVNSDLSKQHEAAIVID
jgi:hypothetical protein